LLFCRFSLSHSLPLSNSHFVAAQESSQGLVIVITTFGGIRFGRPGTRYVSAVTPPLVLGAVVTIYFLIADGLSISRLGIDILAALASVGPWMLAASAVYGWFMFLNEKAKARKPKPRS
jgi:hypothetical protein